MLPSVFSDAIPVWKENMKRKNINTGFKGKKNHYFTRKILNYKQSCQSNMGSNVIHTQKKCKIISKSNKLIKSVFSQKRRESTNIYTFVSRVEINMPSLLEAPSNQQEIS